MVLDAGGRGAEAAGLYDTVSRSDPALTAAAFGLARCRSATLDVAGAVDALARVPDNAVLSGEARLGGGSDTVRGLLLSTDGLWNYASTASTLAGAAGEGLNGEAGDLCARLVSFARRCGGRDNIIAVAGRWNV